MTERDGLTQFSPQSMSSESPRVEGDALTDDGGSKPQGNEECSPSLVLDGSSVNGGSTDAQNESRTDSDSGIGGEGKKSDGEGVESSGGGIPKGEKGRLLALLVSHTCMWEFGSTLLPRDSSWRWLAKIIPQYRK